MPWGVAADGIRLEGMWLPWGTKVGTTERPEVTQAKALAASYQRGNFAWLPDTEPSHSAKNNHQWLKKNMLVFWKLTSWQPSSPHLHPLDFGVRSVIQTYVSHVQCPGDSRGPGMGLVE